MFCIPLWPGTVFIGVLWTLWIVLRCGILRNGYPCFPLATLSKAAAILEPEPTQHDSLDRLQTRKLISNTLQFMSAATLKPIRLECYLSRLSGANKVSLFRADSLASYLLQCAWDSNVVSLNKTYLVELVRDMRPLWDQRDKNYRNRDCKPKFWDEIREKLNVAGQYWNNNTNQIVYYLLIQGVLGGMDKTSGECSLCWTIPI